MNSLQPAFQKRGLDLTEWKRAMHRQPLEYIRRKLRVIEAYHNNLSVKAVSAQINVHPRTVRAYLNTYIAGGLQALCVPEKRPQPTNLTPAQEADFKHQLLHSRPLDHGLEGNIWTGQLMRQYIKQTYSVEYRAGIYDLLERLHLSHRNGGPAKAHADYGNADPLKQQAFLDSVKNALIEADETHGVVVFDEFSVCEKPTSYYGWAEKNTRPTRVTDEKKANGSTAS